jgi:hypothetical protein
MPTIHNPEQGIQEKPPETAPAGTPPESATTTGPAEPARPAKAPPDPAVWTRRLTRVDYALAFLVLLLTFLLASFAVSNSEFWLHLGTGRLIAAGEYTFGEDPFCFTTQGITWVNHQWLYDWSLYGFYELLGEEGLVVGKALLVALMALVLLQIRHRDDALAVPLMCITLAVVAASFQFSFRPILVSLLLLSILLLLVLKNETAWDGAAPPPAHMPRHLWWVPALFILWANLDVWFVAGLLTLGLYWMGLAIQQARTQHVPLAPRHAGMMFGLSLLACLVNPHHVQVFSLPVDLAYPLARLADTLAIPFPDGLIAAGRTMQHIQQYDPGSLPLFSPFSEPFMNGPTTGKLVGAAYFVLLTLSLLSFAAPFLHDAPLPWSRLVPWLFFAVVSLFESRFIVFFAIIATPLTVLNWHDMGRRRAASVSGLSPRSALLLRLAGGLALAGLLFLAWPGWIHGKIGDWHAPRRVAWRLAPEPWWDQSTERLRQLHDAGFQRGLCFNIDIAQYGAWACPDVKHFYDYRFALFPHIVDRVGRIRRELKEETDQYLKRKAPPADESSEWKKTLQQYDLRYIAFTAVRPDRFVERRWIDPAHWPLVHQDGRAFIFGYEATGRADPFARFRVTLAGEAFGKVSADKRTRPQDSFPVKAPGFAELYFHGKPAVSLAAFEFELLSIYSEVQAHWTECVLASSIVSQSHGSFPPASLYLTTPYSGTWSQSNLAKLHEQDKTGTRAAQWWAFNPVRAISAALVMNPAAKVLMMRRARQVLAENPKDVAGFSCLYNAANNLQNLENAWSRNVMSPLRVEIRQMQKLGAIKAMLALDPRNVEVHNLAATLYEQMNYWDVAQEHVALALKHVDRMTPPPGVKDWPQQLKFRKDLLKKRLEAFDEGIGNLAGLKRRRDDFDSAVAGRDDGMIRSKVAFDKGLARLGLSYLEKIVLKDEPNPFRQRDVVYSQLLVLLSLGRSAEVRKLLDTENNEDAKNIQKLFLGIPQAPIDLRWYKLSALAAAVVGDYRTAENSLAVWEDAFARELQHEAFFHAAALCSRFIQPNPIQVGVGLQGLAVGRQRPAVYDPDKRQAVGAKTHGPYPFLLYSAAGLRLSRGLMALEHGNTALATEHFEKVVALLAVQPRFSPDRAIAQEYLLRLKPRR